VPILKPDIQKALQAAGIAKNDEENLNNLLRSSNLDKEQLLDGLSEIVQSAESEAIKLRAIELSFKLHGVLREQAPTPANITIVINDPDNKSTVNPVVLPRQLKENESVN
jgi:hypothetical protein